MERWIEHYLELYPTKNKVSDAALNVINQFPVLEELDGEPPIKEIEQGHRLPFHLQSPRKGRISPRSHTAREGGSNRGAAQTSVLILARGLRTTKQA